MNMPNLATVKIKAFVPAQDFELSMAFYQPLGFTRASVFDGIAYFHCGDSSFLLQDFFVREHADNFQMHLLVENEAADGMSAHHPGSNPSIERTACGGSRPPAAATHVQR